MQRRLGLVAGSVLIAGVVATCGVTSAPSTESPTRITIGFDGTSASFEGPAALDPSEAFEIRLENGSESVVDFAYGRHAPGTDVSTEDAVAWTESQGGPPPWVEESYHLAKDVLPGTTVDVDCQPSGCWRLMGERSRADVGQLMAGHRYEFLVWNVDTEQGFIAVVIDVGPSATE